MTGQPQPQPETRHTVIDGRDALAFVIIRPGQQEGAVTIDAAARGLSKPDAARTLRHVADLWDPTDPTTAPDPTPLRWGLNDVLWGDDNTVTVCLSGPAGEPYWLELDPERAAVLRQDLAGPPSA